MTHQNSSSQGASRSVVVPVYEGPDVVTRCLAALESHTDPNTTALIVDDGSQDPAVGSCLHDFQARRPNSKMTRNRSNIGFTRTVNLGFEFTCDRDGVIFNSDTQVTPDWLDRMERLLRDRPDAATVTPVSNAAGAFSVPLRGRNNPLSPGHNPDSMARLVSSF